PHRFQFFSCEGRHRLPLLSELNGGIVRLPLRELYNAHGLPLTVKRQPTVLFDGCSHLSLDGIANFRIRSSYP
ncbi:hypothetical protein, partial [Paraburkholderia sp. NMBU_R16]|uniref:hypothetical protein n=1 Tax=Paraburkholderia sp. NMBU_R16 TaxID=2698676 RepID=UPI001C26E8BC